MEDGIPGGLQHPPKTYSKKDGHHGRQTCMFGGDFTTGMYFWMSGLAYDTFMQTRLSLLLKA